MDINSIIEMIIGMKANSDYKGYSNACDDIIEQLRKMSDWQDISTAPKDENILLYGAKRLDYCVGRFQNDEWITESSHEWHSMYTPTNWMPLPLPPSKAL